MEQDQRQQMVLMAQQQRHWLTPKMVFEREMSSSSSRRSQYLH
jgi:hypothetical protein